MEAELGKALKLSPDEAKIYNNLIQSVSTLPKTDPRFTLVIGFTWWLIHRRRRLEQQRIRRKQFQRRWRRILLLHNHFRARPSDHSDAEVELDDYIRDEPMVRRVPEPRQRQRFSFNKEMTTFWQQIVNNEMDDEVFQQYFHMTKDTFDFIYTELREHLSKSNTSMREALPGKKRLAVTLFRIANNAEYLKVSNLFSIGKSTTTSLVRDVCEVIVAQLKDKYLTWFSNLTNPQLAFTPDIKEKAESVLNIPNCYGVLGSIDVFTVGSSWNYNDANPCKSIFYNGQHALAFQTVVNYNGLFCYMSVPPQPAGYTNAEVYTNSGLEKELIEFDEQDSNDKQDELKIGDVRLPGMILVADKTYPLTSYVMTPYPENALATEKNDSEGKHKFNAKLEYASSMFDDAIYKLKKRWKIFHGKNGKINFNTDTFENIALTCCILHNICELRGDLTWSGSEDPACRASNEVLKDELFRRTIMDFGLTPELNDLNSDEEGNIIRDALASFDTKCPK